jgi:hypothetical protein
MRVRAVNFASNFGLRAALSCAALTVAIAAPSTALAQDAGPADAGSGGPTPTLPMCAGAINTADVPVMGERMGPVDMLPGTGMGMAGSSTFGLRYNLLFSGDYTLRMAGTLHVNWLGGVNPLTVSTDGTPMTGFLRVRYGLRMMATLYVVGAAIPIDLSNIIMDNESTGEKTFNPWQWDYTDDTRIALNVSAYRTVYMNSVTVAGETYPYELQMRFNMQTRAKTEKIDFPNRSSGAMGQVFGALTGTTPQVTIGVPADGRLDLAYRWQPRIRYTGSLQFRLIVSRRVCVAGICSNIDVPTPDLGSIPLENELIPTAWERSAPVLIPPRARGRARGRLRQRAHQHHGDAAAHRAQPGRISAGRRGHQPRRPGLRARHEHHVHRRWNDGSDPSDLLAHVPRQLSQRSARAQQRRVEQPRARDAQRHRRDGDRPACAHRRRHPHRRRRRERRRRPRGLRTTGRRGLRVQDQRLDAGPAWRVDRRARGRGRARRASSPSRRCVTVTAAA